MPYHIWKLQVSFKIFVSWCSSQDAFCDTLWWKWTSYPALPEDNLLLCSLFLASCLISAELWRAPQYHNHLFLWWLTETPTLTGLSCPSLVQCSSASQAETHIEQFKCCSEHVNECTNERAPQAVKPEAGCFSKCVEQVETHFCLRFSILSLNFKEKNKIKPPPPFLAIYRLWQLIKGCSQVVF